MDIPWVAVGTVVGVAATVAIAWINQKTLNRRELLREEIRAREALYGEFISECARLLLDAFQHSLEKPEELLPAYALLNRVRLCASREVLTAGSRLLDRITDQYFATNLTAQELFRLARSSQADPLREFGEACRAELNAIREALSAKRIRPHLSALPSQLPRSPMSHQTPTVP